MHGQLSKGRKYIDYEKYLSNLLFLEQRQRGVNPLHSLHLYFLLSLFARQHLEDPNPAGNTETTTARELAKESRIFYSKDEPWKFFTPNFYILSSL